MCALQRCSHVFVLKVSLDIVDLNALASTVKEARTSGRPRKPAGGLINEDLVILDDATEEVNVEWEEERSDFEGKDNGEEVRGLGTTPRSPRAPPGIMPAHICQTNPRFPHLLYHIHSSERARWRRSSEKSGWLRPLRRPRERLRPPWTRPQGKFGPCELVGDTLHVPLVWAHCRFPLTITPAQDKGKAAATSQDGAQKSAA